MSHISNIGKFLIALLSCIFISSLSLFAAGVAGSGKIIQETQMINKNKSTANSKQIRTPNLHTKRAPRTNSSDALSFFSGKGFSLQVPKAWTAVNQKSLPKPKNGSIVLALTSTDIASGFANNFSILKDTLVDDRNTSMSSRKYAVVNAALSSGSYKKYTKLNDSNITFSDGDEGLVTIFEAKYNLDTPKQKFLQTAKICNKKDVYLMTIVLAISTSDTLKYESILKTFSCDKSTNNPTVDDASFNNF